MVSSAARALQQSICSYSVKHATVRHKMHIATACTTRLLSASNTSLQQLIISSRLVLTAVLGNSCTVR
eukprot:3292-Heterococcus_DN1.PRE.2